MLKFLFLLVISVCFFVLGSGPSHAYLDPGTGSTFLQILAGAFAAGAVSIKLFSTTIKNYWVALKKRVKSH